MGLVIIYMQYAFYAKDMFLMVFWVVSLLMNIGIVIINSRRLKLSKIIIEIFLSNFIILAVYIFLKGNFNLLKRLTTAEKFLDYFFAVFVIIITGNWSLPLIYYIMQKYIRKRLIQKKNINISGNF
jgi:hypothetical protein